MAEAGSPQVVARIADRYRKQGRFAEAIALCLRELEARPTYVSARVVLGRAYMESGDHAQAEEEFHRVVESSPENLRARMHLGEICAAQGRRHEAIRHYQAALERAPLDREIRARLMKLGGSVSPFAPSLSTQWTQGVSMPSREVMVPDFTAAKEELLATETLADLYASQGFTERASAIYRQLLDEEPSRDGIRTKLTVLQETRREAAGPPCVSLGATAIPPTWRASEPGFATEGLPVFELSEESGTVAAAPSFRMSRQRILLLELERWLQGVRRYRRLAAGQ
ncbi:MAG: tetratricopeptide repeat protein [Candidatus Methylomirabilis sp.]